MPAIASSDDDVLIRRVIEGDTECFTVLVERHLGLLKNHIRSMLRNTTDADDLVQEVLVKLWIHLPAFRFESSFRAWAMRIATNEVLQSYRNKRRYGLCQPPEDLEHIPSSAESPIQNVVRVECAQILRRAILRLPATYRQILLLRYIEERDERETARCLQSSIATVKNRSFRARQMLRTSLQRARFDVPARSSGFMSQPATRP